MLKIYHEDSIDGVVATSLVLRHYLVNGFDILDSIEVTPVDHNQIPTEHIKEEDLVFLLGCRVSPKTMKAIYKKTFNVLLCEVHKETIAALEQIDLPKIGMTQLFAGGSLSLGTRCLLDYSQPEETLFYLEKRPSNLNSLICYVHDYATVNEDPATIDYIVGLKETFSRSDVTSRTFVYDWVGMEFCPKALIEKGRVLRTLKEEHIQEIYKGTITYNNRPLTFIAYPTTPEGTAIPSSLLGDYDIYMECEFFDGHWVCTFNTTDKDIDLDFIVRKFHGFGSNRRAITKTYFYPPEVMDKMVFQQGEI